MHRKFVIMYHVGVAWFFYIINAIDFRHGHDHGHGHGHGPPLPLQKVDIGKREIVGFGGNGEITYIDSVMSPFPAIRFKEDSGDIARLREKEKGDWKKLTKETLPKFC